MTGEKIFGHFYLNEFKDLRYNYFHNKLLCSSLDHSQRKLPQTFIKQGKRISRIANPKNA